MQKLEFPANIFIRTCKPVEGVQQASLAQIVMTVDKLPFMYIFETPDPKFIEGVVAALVEIAAELRANPLNAEFEGKHPNSDPAAVDAATLEDVGGSKNVEAAPAPASNSPVPATGEGE